MSFSPDLVVPRAASAPDRSYAVCIAVPAETSNCCKGEGFDLKKYMNQYNRLVVQSRELSGLWRSNRDGQAMGISSNLHAACREQREAKKKSKQDRCNQCARESIGERQHVGNKIDHEDNDGRNPDGVHPSVVACFPDLGRQCGLIECNCEHTEDEHKDECRYERIHEPVRECQTVSKVCNNEQNAGPRENLTQ